MPSYWRLYCLNNTVHCILILMTFPISGSLKCFMTYSTNSVRHYMAKCKGTDTNHLLKSVSNNRPFSLEYSAAKIKMQLRKIKLQKFQWMLQLFISKLHGSSLTENVMKLYTAIFRSVENGSTALWLTSRMLPFTQTGRVSTKYITTGVDVCFIHQIAWHISHTFHCRWRVDGGWMRKCAHSLMSVQTFLI